MQKVLIVHFEEEVMLGGFGNAEVKPEGSGVVYESAQETFTARYTHETIALAFSLTEEAVEDNLYDKISTRYTKALARSMANTKQIKAANVLNRAFNSSYLGGDDKELCATDHTTMAGDQKNELSTAADLNETSLEQMHDRYCWYERRKRNENCSSWNENDHSCKSSIYS